MKKTLIFLFCLALPVVPGSAILSAQEYNSTQVSISKDKVRANGNIYYAHSVLERQTLYSISKAYGVSVEEIYAANPGLEQTGLQKGSVILIPTVSASQAEEEAKEESGMVSADEVARQESSRKGTRKSRAGSEDRVTDEYIVHTVKWYEDLDDIARRYEVSADLIMEYNKLRTTKLRKGMKIKIPIEAHEEGQAAAQERERALQEQAAREKSEEIARQREEENASVSWEVFGRKDQVSVAVVLPFEAGGNADDGCLDFYSGLLLAVRDIGNAGTQVDLKVYDCSKGMVTADRLDGVDLVIGPVSEEDLERVLKEAPSGTCVVSPLDQKAAGLDSLYMNFVQAPTPSDIQYQDVVDWVSEDSSAGDNIVVISEKSSRKIPSTQLFSSIIETSGLQYKNFSYSLLEGRNIYNSMAAALVPDVPNRIIINSENEAFVTDVVRNLGVAAFNKFDIAVYGPSKLHSFTSLDTESLHNLYLHVSLSYYVDYDSQAVKDFLYSYRALYNSEPSQFSFQGYDVARYFIGLTARHGNRWLRKMSDHRDVPGKMLQVDFVLNKRPGGGWHNEGIRRIVYGEDYEIKLQK